MNQPSANSLKHSEYDNFLVNDQAIPRIFSNKDEKFTGGTKGLTAEKMNRFEHFMERTAEIWVQKLEKSSQNVQDQSAKAQILTNLTLTSNDRMMIIEKPKNVLSRSVSMNNSKPVQQVHFRKELNLLNSLTFGEKIQSGSFADSSLSENKINKKFEWGSLEDEKLLKLAIELKYDWEEVAKQISNQEDIDANFLENRYQELKEGPILSTRSKFTEEEDAKILYYIKIHGTRWKVIAKMLPGRNPVAVKNRFYSALKGRVNLRNISKSKRRKEKKRTPKKMSLDEDIEVRFRRSEEFQGEEAHFVYAKSENGLESQDVDFDCGTFFDFEKNAIGENESGMNENNKKNSLFMSPPIKAFKNADCDFPKRDSPISGLGNLKALGYSPNFNNLFESFFPSKVDPKQIEEEEEPKNQEEIRENLQLDKEKDISEGSKEILEEMNKKMESLSSLYSKIHQDFEKLSQIYKKG